MKPLVVIPARGGSKGVPGKNIKLLGGKPLIQYTIEAARKLFDDDVICVSTDNIEIKKVVENLGLVVPFIRPKELATDTSSSYEVLLHAIQFYESNGYCPDTVILLQPTSPFRTGEHLKAAIELFHSDLDMIVSVKETKSNPYYVLFEENSNGFLRKFKEAYFKRRQDAPKVWEYNGAVYIINVSSIHKSAIKDFRKIKKFEMDEVSSLDIDDMIDFKFAEFLVNEK